jgi:pSer/pThr/pTyr-binding forkhead associated (FHA) protein
VGLARLTLKRSGVLTSETFQLGERVTVGRFDPDSGPVDVDLGALPEAPYISRHHAEIWRDAAGQWFIKDLGSRSGTFVRATGQTQFQRVTGEQAINDGDEVALANARFEFRTNP